ncbi:MAG TPA: hypothetical protein PLL75_06605 [Candidatus Omnitrophota bacterium]|nr:hypothetical protein [Candidatus Omnitrophota bacterium]HPS37378.1 hypothetical protein [Candidatus Omnitrophota bacterium]
MNENQQEKQESHKAFLYANLSSEERESAIYFLLESILKVRDQDPAFACGNRFDEDVNIYLAHLLFATSLPEYHEMADPFISSRPEEVFEWVRDTDDPMLRYFIFKVNADHLLIQSTILDPELAKGKRFFSKKDKPDEKRMAARMYYRHACKCHEVVYDKKTGVGEVLGKIAENLDLYFNILSGAREDYFKFIDCFRDQAFQRFFQQLEHYEDEHRREIKLDQFLESYQRWLATHDGCVRNRILELARELKGLDPQFRFDPAKLN